jgi:hypothetical protein
MDKFSDSRLKRMKHYGFPFFYKSAKTAIADYNKEIQNGKMSFSRAILILYPKKNQESKNLVALYQKALIFRNNKRLRKRSFELVLENLLATALILIPLLVPLLSFDCYLAWWKYILIYILTFIFAVLFGFVLVPCLNFLTNFKVKIGKLFTGFFKFILLFSVCLSAYFFLGLEDGVVVALSLVMA